MLHTQLAALALAATTMAASGCGSSKSGATATSAASAPATTPATSTALAPATGAPLSRARWIAAGDAICQHTLAEIETLGFRTPAEFAQKLPRAVPIYVAEAEGLAKLVPPRSATHDWEQVVGDVHAFSEYANQTAQDLKEHKMGAITTEKEKTAKLQNNMMTVAKHDGFKWCSQGE